MRRGFWKDSECGRVDGVTALTLLLVFIGGGAGAACRYSVGCLVGRAYHGAFPVATVAINVTGCFAIGLLLTLLAREHHDAALPTALLATGFLGGYTTFSTYALEGVVLWNDDKALLALANLAGSVAAGLLAAGAGASIARLL